MRFNHSIFVAIGIVSAFAASPGHATHSMRADNPGSPCFAPDWSPIVFDPYASFDANADGTQNPAVFFSPGTVTDQPAIFCAPTIVYSTTTPTLGDSANPASKPDPNTGAPTIADLTATGGVMYEWINANDNNLTPDAEVIVWTLPSSTTLPNGAFELEFDNWCGYNDGGFGSTPAPPSAVPSFTWNGNRYNYYLTCANFNGNDLLLDSLGLVIGYVDDSANDLNNTIITKTAPGWQVAYATQVRLSISPKSAPTGTCVHFIANVNELTPGSPKVAGAGTVTFFNGTSPLATVTPNAVGEATFNTASLTAGKYAITAAYTTDVTTHANYGADSQSGSQSLTVTSTQKVVPCP